MTLSGTKALRGASMLFKPLSTRKPSFLARKGFPSITLSKTPALEGCLKMRVKVLSVVQPAIPYEKNTFVWV